MGTKRRHQSISSEVSDIEIEVVDEPKRILTLDDSNEIEHSVTMNDSESSSSGDSSCDSDTSSESDSEEVSKVLPIKPKECKFILEDLDLGTFYSISGRNHLSKYRCVERSIFDYWHEYMCTLVTRNPTPSFSSELSYVTSDLHTARDRLNAFYAWYLDGCHGTFLDVDVGYNGAVECWVQKWNRTQDHSIIGGDQNLFSKLYDEFRLFLMQVEFKKDLLCHVHIVLLLHSIMFDYSPDVHADLLEKLGLENGATVPVSRILHMNHMTLIGDVWNVGHHFSRNPHFQISKFFIFLAERAESVLGAAIDKLVLCEKKTLAK